MLFRSMLYNNGVEWNAKKQSEFEKNVKKIGETLRWCVINLKELGISYEESSFNKLDEKHKFYLAKTIYKKLIKTDIYNEKKVISYNYYN